MSKQVKARGGYRPGSGRKAKATEGWTQIRVTVETRDALREQAREAGFESMGEYVKVLSAFAREAAVPLRRLADGYIAEALQYEYPLSLSWAEGEAKKALDVLEGTGR